MATVLPSFAYDPAVPVVVPFSWVGVGVGVVVVPGPNNSNSAMLP
jgi:hypothetical protein